MRRRARRGGKEEGIARLHTAASQNKYAAGTDLPAAYLLLLFQ